MLILGWNLQCYVRIRIMYLLLMKLIEEIYQRYLENSSLWSNQTKEKERQIAFLLSYLILKWISQFLIICILLEQWILQTEASETLTMPFAGVLLSARLNLCGKLRKIAILMMPQKDEAKKLYLAVQNYIKQSAVDMDYEDLMVGHSYFMYKEEESLEQRWKFEILPLLNEYYKDGICCKSPLEDIRQKIQMVKKKKVCICRNL